VFRLFGVPYSLLPRYACRVAGADDQLKLVRERFTRTAEEFAGFSLTTRSREAELLVELAAPEGPERALDLACGPGTFTRALAPHVRFLVALDITPALLEQARGALAGAGARVTFACADAMGLPLADASLDLAACGYSLHHFVEPRRALEEMARVVRRGGRVAVMDLVAPPEAERAARHNEIERVRDASHAVTLGAADLRISIARAGLRILREQITERHRSFDDWMQIAGWRPGDAAYAETRRRMETSIAGDTAGFRPRLVSEAAPSDVARAGDIEFVQVSLAVVAART
jgi:ubiquinone/menaquinone biosynthesis C-methylase UbiE